MLLHTKILEYFNNASSTEYPAATENVLFAAAATSALRLIQLPTLWVLEALSPEVIK
jgi:hypothetical protein